MIVEEKIGNDKVKTYSSDGKKIKQVEGNFICDFAVDVYPCPYTYEEYDGELPEDEVDDLTALDILLGGVS